MIIRVCQTIVQPYYVKVQSSSTDRFYDVIPSTVFNDAICECPGFIWRGYCKHVTHVEELRCQWMDPLPGSDIDDCPRCGAPAVDFELEGKYA